MFAQDIQNNKVKGNGYNFIDLFAGAGDAASFADSIADCYRHVLKRAKVYMLENYNFYKAASVRIPEKY